MLASCLMGYPESLQELRRELGVPSGSWPVIN